MPKKQTTRVCTIGIMAQLEPGSSEIDAAEIEKKASQAITSKKHPVRAARALVYSSSDKNRPLQFTPEKTGKRVRTKTPRKRLLKRAGKLNLKKIKLSFYVEEDTHKPSKKLPSASKIAKFEKSLPPSTEQFKTAHYTFKKGQLGKPIPLEKKKRSPTQNQVMGNCTATDCGEIYGYTGSKHWGHELDYLLGEPLGIYTQTRRNMVAIPQYKNLATDTRATNSLIKANRKHAFSLTLETELVVHPTKENLFVHISKRQKVTVSPLNNITNTVSAITDGTTIPKERKAYGYLGNFFAAGFEGKFSNNKSATVPKHNS